MNTNEPYLFISTNEKQISFFVVKFTDEPYFEVLYSDLVKSNGITNGKILDIDTVSSLIKKNITKIEKKIDFTFSKATLINDQENYNCINVSGFKKLYGSQVLDKDISYILNNVKKLIVDNEPHESIIHLLNSDFILDKTHYKKPPTNLHGNFYTQHLTFFLLPKNDLKNIKLVLNKCNINIERVILKSFLKGIKKINKDKENEKFSLITIGKSKSNISIFQNSSFVFAENFSFGSNIILKDISKLCSLDNKIIENIISNNCIDDISFNTHKYVDKKYFEDSAFRKISLEHISEIARYRIEEIINLIFKANINIKDFKNKIDQIYLSFEDPKIFYSLKNTFTDQFPSFNKVVAEKLTQDEHIDICQVAAELVGKGWEKEAIPVIQDKKSRISRLFQAIFN